MERQVNLVHVVAGLMWAGVVVLVACGAMAGMAWDHAGFHMANVLMCSGLALSAAAATVSIKAMLCRQNRMFQDAFELGRDSGSTMRRVR